MPKQPFWRVLIAAEKLPDASWQACTLPLAPVFVHDQQAIVRELQTGSYQAAVFDLSLCSGDGLPLLRQVRRANWCPFLILSSQTPNFPYARQGMLCGANDYLLQPITPEALYRTLTQLQTHSIAQQADLSLVLLPALGTPRFPDLLEHALSTLSPLHHTVLVNQLVQQAFAKHTWLSLYLSAKACTAAQDASLVQCRESALALHKLLYTLCPPVQQVRLTEILQYLCAEVDKQLSQKQIAAHFFISPATLSNCFSAERLSYHAQNQTIRLARAAFLIRTENLKQVEVCRRLGFCDSGYFGKCFAAQYGMRPLEYRHQAAKKARKNG